MDRKNITGNLIKTAVLFLNVILAAGGVYYFKNKDQQKKEIELTEEKSFNEEVAKYEIDQIQDAFRESGVQKMESIANNPDTVIKQETVTVEKIIPAVTEQVKVPKPSKSTSTS